MLATQSETTQHQHQWDYFGDNPDVSMLTFYPTREAVTAPQCLKRKATNR